MPNMIFYYLEKQIRYIAVWQSKFGFMKSSLYLHKYKMIQQEKLFKFKCKIHSTHQKFRLNINTYYNTAFCILK